MLTKPTAPRARFLASTVADRLPLETVAELLTPPRHHHTAVLEAIICETQTAALLSATVTSIVNALGDLPGSTAVAALRQHQPSGQSSLPTLRGWLADADVDPLNLRATVHFYLDVNRGLGKLRDLFNDANSLGPERAAVLHRRELERSWRAVCDQAIAAANDLDAEIGAQVNELYQISMGVLLPMLGEASDGGRPCIDAEGRPFVPTLPQRRRAPRRMMNQDCSLHVRRKTVRALVRDVAIGGFGLSKVGIDLARNDILVMELRNGRRFTGSVMWAKDGLAGVKLATPLSLTDPLIAA